MNYAVIKNGIVVNVVRLVPSSAKNYTNYVDIDDYSIDFGDEYIDGFFYRNGEKILSKTEQLQQAQEIIAELDAALVDATYQNLIGG